MKRIASLLLFIILFVQVSRAQIQSPEEFLGYKLGEHWTPHYKVEAYFRHVAEQSPMVTFRKYGKTYEGRELVYVVVATEENQANIEEIRHNNLKLTGLEEGEPTTNQKAIVWLSYNVHGNEVSSSEAAMNTLYKLITEKPDLLTNVIVVMDPIINPDGRDRYVNWYNSVVGKHFDPVHDAREHHEPWPGGRVNHYYFDLNRDWAWQTQIETQQHIKVYQEWMPQVHVDYHEQGYSEPYYFAPAAKPLHNAISQWQRDFQVQIGKNHAKYFDQNSWLYFTKEYFDLFYPSYGDTWPIFNGAIGMTYEQAGGGFSGLGVLKAEGDTLTALDRLTHHTVTGLSTVEITAKNYKKVIDEFAAYFKEARENAVGTYKAFIVKKDNNPDKVKELLTYLDNQKIRYGYATSAGSYEGYDYTTGKTGKVAVAKTDIVISTYQPKGTLVSVLFEPKPELEDSLTYDITAWELHYAYGLKGFAVKNKINASSKPEPEKMKMATAEVAKPYAYLAKWNSMEDVKFLTRLLNNGIKVRYAEAAFSVNGHDFEPGTLIITRNGNVPMGEEFDELVKKAAEETNHDLMAVESGFVTSGKDFGSSGVHYIEKPNVALIAGSGTYANYVGHIWHFFDQQIDYPITLINLDDLKRATLSDFQVILMPSGSYGRVLDDNALGDLKDWVRKGGTLVAFDGANNFLAGKDGFDLKLKKKDDDKEKENPDAKLKKYGDAERSSAQGFNAGSVFEIKLDTTHPLAFGFDDTYFSLKLGSTAFDYLDDGWNVGVAQKDALRSGFVGNIALKELENTLTFGVQDMGRGKVVYMIDNPLFRGFWHNGKLLVANAVFFVGN